MIEALDIKITKVFIKFSCSYTIDFYLNTKCGIAHHFERLKLDFGSMTVFGHTEASIVTFLSH